MYDSNVYYGTATDLNHIEVCKSVTRVSAELTLESSRSMLSRLLLRWMRPLMRRREGFPWLMGNERVEVAGIAIAPAPPIAPIGPSEHPGAPEGEVSPSWGVTLEQKREKIPLDTDDDLPCPFKLQPLSLCLAPYHTHWHNHTLDCLTNISLYFWGRIRYWGGTSYY